MQRGLVGSEMCIRDSINAEYMGTTKRGSLPETANPPNELNHFATFDHSYREEEKQQENSIPIIRIKALPNEPQPTFKRKSRKLCELLLEKDRPHQVSAGIPKMQLASSTLSPGRGPPTPRDRVQPPPPDRLILPVTMDERLRRCFEKHKTCEKSRKLKELIEIQQKKIKNIPKGTHSKGARSFREDSVQPAPLNTIIEEASDTDSVVMDYNDSKKMLQRKISIRLNDMDISGSLQTSLNEYLSSTNSVSNVSTSPTYAKKTSLRESSEVELFGSTFIFQLHLSLIHI
eukprot:TRINITY_DN15028_c0_g1_i1.p1 TRINITY_DN15028_c0_g1~~TRINITY_DN15028_c0_g1_i1.p1  ORF type:complete len:288 (+),score=37.89 TRINITY_DN15028_c0_g1_i1:129-992(+)